MRKDHEDYTLFYKQRFNKQRHEETDKKSSKSLAAP